MKKLLLFFLVFLRGFMLMAQPGHTLPSIVLVNPDINKDQLLSNYNLSITIFEQEDSIYLPVTKELITEVFYGKRKKENIHVAIPIFTHENSREIKKGSVICLSLEHKELYHKMDIYIRLGKHLSEMGFDDLYFRHFEFQEGKFFYDFCIHKYLDNSDSTTFKSLAPLFRHSISSDFIHKILRSCDCTDNYLKLNLNNTYEDTLKIAIYTNYKRLEKMWRPVTTISNFNQLEFPDNFMIGENRESGSFTGISFIDTQGQKMLIYFKIYKRYEDYNRNQITLKNFKFQEGIFYYDMKTYQAGDCETPRFIDEFDLSNIQEYVITTEEMNQILEEHKE